MQRLQAQWMTVIKTPTCLFCSLKIIKCVVGTYIILRYLSGVFPKTGFICKFGEIGTQWIYYSKWNVFIRRHKGKLLLSQEYIMGYGNLIWFCIEFHIEAGLAPWPSIKCYFCPSKGKTLGTLIQTQHQITYRDVHSVGPDYLAGHVPRGFINYSCWESKAQISITSAASTLLKSIPGHTFIDQRPGALPNKVPAHKWNVFFFRWGCAGCVLFMLCSLSLHRQSWACTVAALLSIDVWCVL